MRTTTLFCVVISMVLVMQAEAWWSRRETIRCRKRDTRQRAEEELTEGQVTQLTQDLVKTCPSLGFDPTVGLTRDVIGTVFTKNDADSSGALSGTELEKFSDMINAYELCKNLDKVTS